MKVYYKMDGIDELFATDNEAFNDTKDYITSLLMQKRRYQVMWALRSLEGNIADEEGIIIIDGLKGFETKGFSAALTEKIRGLLLEEFS